MFVRGYRYAAAGILYTERKNKK